MNDLSTQNHKNRDLEQTYSKFASNSETDREIFFPTSSSNLKNQKVIRVLIAEDQLTCQKILQSYLKPEADLELIGTAIDGQAALELVKKLKPDVVLMDINMPKLDGLTATEIITNRYLDT